ncbi:Hypothetical predicted protein [Paramuricea clavata]|uniref:Uncharacterized protein n=1 Tax=Paramuricea clavata TaxID=317549 RepID=A0A6S7HYP9_PARCT|nr:Hypothetical predicted protein [Paramuricea clavata]
METFKTEQVINSETVRSLAESVERLASIVPEIQTNVKSEAQDPCDANDLEINNDNNHKAKIYELVNDIEHNNTKPTYAALVKSQLVKESLSKSVLESSLEPTLESLASVNNKQ